MTEEALTEEQQRLAGHLDEVFAEACPGSGKTRTIVDRVACLSVNLPPRKGMAVLSFTNAAVEVFTRRCRKRNLEAILHHPSFIGTFDAFIRQFLIFPSCFPHAESAPVIVDSWDSLGVEVRLRRRYAFFLGVSLDKFDPLDGHIEPSRIGHIALRRHVEQNRQAYELAARRFHEGLNQKGYLTAADARILTLQSLARVNWSSALGKALKGRFFEIIVDEAQDCNPEDIRILTWLKESGIRLTTVCDPDQAIYEFRHGDPVLLQEFSRKYSPANKLPLTGNFRSAPAICALAATLRTRSAADNPLGENATLPHPVQIICYQGSPAADISSRFIGAVKGLTPDLKEYIILSHAARHAIHASGNRLSSAEGSSKIARMADIVNDFWSPFLSNKKREAALQSTEKIILGLMGKIEDNEHPARAAERCHIDRRELRRKALQLVVSLPKTCQDSDASRSEWIAFLLSAVQRLSLSFPAGHSERTFFRKPKSNSWADPLLVEGVVSCSCSTIHQVKGKEFEAVCVVLPPDRPPGNNTSKLFEAWERRVDDEAKRVIYVGITRAKKVVGLAIPEAFKDRIVNILNSANVPFSLVA